MHGALAPSAYARIGRVSSQPEVHAAFRWLHLQQGKIMDWQRDLVSIAAPPFGENIRAEWLTERFRDLGLRGIEIDPEGNALGWMGPESSACVMLSAHLDTVFPGRETIHPVIDGARMEAPGACDNGAGLAALLAIAGALQASGIALRGPLLFVGNVGEEGEGDLRGMRYVYESSPWRDRIAAHLVLDGAGSSAAVTRALGSRRYRVSIHASGGHPWANAGAPNPIVVLSHAIASLSALDLTDFATASWNVGSIEGGTSVNSIPERASALFDLRSLSTEGLDRLEAALRRSIEESAQNAGAAAGRDPETPRGTEASLAARSRGAAPRRGSVWFDIDRIGERPAARLPADSPLLESLRAVDRRLGIRTEEHTASTDANIPLSRGVPAIGIGAGGEGGGVHTRAEWYDATGRDLALRRILLLLLVLP